jgi:hypothetical protein
MDKEVGRMSNPKLIDLYSCAGGAAVGYSRAGFDVYGVDIVPRDNYPFSFHLGDALEVLATLIAGGMVDFRHPDGSVEWLALEDFAAAHGSPPCQASTALTKGTNKGLEYINLIPETRAAFALLGIPTIIENVQGSDLRRDLILCGEMFGLGVLRHRYFELGNWSMIPPAHVPHRGKVRGWRHGEYFDGPYLAVYGNGGGKGSVAEWQKAMGIDWTDDRKEIAEAIPPAMTLCIGERLRELVHA